MLGLAIAFAISALVNLALVINYCTRETILLSGQWLINRVQAICANPNTNSNPTPPNAERIESAQTLPPPPPPPPAPAIVWPSVRPTAPPPPPPPRNLCFGAKGIFETGKTNLTYPNLT